MPESYEPIEVRAHIASVEPGAQLGQAARRTARVTRFGTETADNTNPVRPLLPEADGRICAYVQAGGGDVYLCDSEAKAIQAASSGTALEVTPANPGAGSSFTYTNQSGVPLLLQSARFTFTADTVASNRFVSVQILDASGFTVAENSDLTAVVASTSLTMFLAAGLPNVPNAASGTVLGGLPNVALQPGWQVKINVSGIDAADQLSAIGLTFTAPGGGGASAQGMLLPHAFTAPWPVEGDQAVWIAQVNPGTTCIVSYSAEYETGVPT